MNEMFPIKLCYIILRVGLGIVDIFLRWLTYFNGFDDAGMGENRLLCTTIND